MLVWISILIPVLASIILLVFFKKQTMWWEIALLLVPSALLILSMNRIMVSSNESDTEYWGGYITKVIYYEEWDEEVPCMHPVYCTGTRTDSKGNVETYQYECGHQHAYDVDFHPEHWTKESNTGHEYEISKSVFLVLQKQFNTKPYFVDLKRDYHSIDGDSYNTDWNKLQETCDIITTEHSYKNKVRASHSIFKFENISEKEKLKWKLYDYPNVSGLYQGVILGKGVDYSTDRKLQYLNGFYGSQKQFRMYILFFKEQSMDVAFKQRSFWDGGNKNEFIVCIGTDGLGKYKWCKCFSWMDRPELEVGVESYFNDQQNKFVDLSVLADWMPQQIEKHWKRKEFKDFEYLNVEISSFQLMWVLIIVGIYNIGMSIWVFFNEFKNDESVNNIFDRFL